MSDDEDDNVRQLGVEKQDLVRDLADQICKVLTRNYDVNVPEEHLAALYLAEAAVQHIVVAKKGPAELNRVIGAANEIRKTYGFTLRPPHTVYDEEEQPKAAPIVPLFGKKEVEEQCGPGPITTTEEKGIIQREEKDEGA
jgi:hypothetical protein